MVKCKGCGQDRDIWKLRDRLCGSCRGVEVDEPNYFSFYDDDPIYELLEGIRVAIVNLTDVIKTFKKKELGWTEVLDIIDRKKGANKNE